MPKPQIEFESQRIRFRNEGRLLAERPLEALERAYTAFCFNPEAVPADNPSYNVLDFGDALWVVPHEAASRYISVEWAEHLATRGGFFYAESAELPRKWRRRSWMILRHPYHPKATVVSKQELPFTQTSERIDPRYLADYNRLYVARLMNP